MNYLEHKELVHLLNKKAENKRMEEMEEKATPFFICAIVLIFILAAVL